MPTCTRLSSFTPTCTRLHLPHSFTIYSDSISMHSRLGRSFLCIRVYLHGMYLYSFVLAGTHSFSLIGICSHPLVLVAHLFSLARIHYCWYVFLLDGTHSSSLIHTHFSLCTLILTCAHSFSSTHLFLLVRVCVHWCLFSLTRLLSLIQVHW